MFIFQYFYTSETPLCSNPDLCVILEDTHNTGLNQQVGLHFRQVLRSCLRIVLLLVISVLKTVALHPYRPVYYVSFEPKKDV